MQPTLKPRIFTMEEANKFVPFLEESFAEIRELNRCLHVLSQDLRDLVNVWGDYMFSEKNPDNKYYKELLSKRDAGTEALNGKIGNMHSLGCIIKDVDKGLVDFYHELNGKTVFLCWRSGEKKVQFWHDINAGFVGRKSIAELIRS